MMQKKLMQILVYLCKLPKIFIKFIHFLILSRYFFFSKI